MKQLPYNPKYNPAEDVNLRGNLLEIYLKSLLHLQKDEKGTTAYKQTQLLKENLEEILGLDIEAIEVYGNM